MNYLKWFQNILRRFVPLEPVTATGPAEEKIAGIKDMINLRREREFSSTERTGNALLSGDQGRYQWEAWVPGAKGRPENNF